jgi:hypothetical protein
MTESAPYPGEPSLQDLSHPTRGVFVRLEDGHVRGMVPSFYREHIAPNETTVMHDGKPMESCGKTFTVAQVPIERRWAILPNGEVMGELEFRKHHVAWYEEYFRELARENPDLQNVDGGKPDYDIPDPLRFVAVQVDPTNPRKFVPVNYAPHETQGARSNEFYTRDGEKVDADRMQVLCNAYADPRLRKRLSVMEIQEVEDALGITTRGAGEIASKLELLNSMLTAGDLTAEQHSRQVALLTGAPVPTDAKATGDPTAGGEPAVEAGADEIPTEENPDEPKTYTGKTRCGREFTKPTLIGSKSSVRNHERVCPACKEMAE